MLEFSYHRINFSAYLYEFSSYEELNRKIMGHVWSFPSYM